MLVTAVCMLFLLKLKWPKNKNFVTLTCCMQTKNRKCLKETVNNEQLLPDLELKSGIPTGTNSDNSLKVPLKSMYMATEPEDNYVQTPILLHKIENFT